MDAQGSGKQKKNASLNHRTNKKTIRQTEKSARSSETRLSDGLSNRKKKATSVHRAKKKIAQSAKMGMPDDHAYENCQA